MRGGATEPLDKEPLAVAVEASVLSALGELLTPADILQEAAEWSHERLWERGNRSGVAGQEAVGFA